MSTLSTRELIAGEVSESVLELFDSRVEQIKRGKLWGARLERLYLLTKNLVSLPPRIERDCLVFEGTDCDQKALLMLQELIPWRMGPFQICGHQITAEWRSDLLWGRLGEATKELRGLTVADIGSSSGYLSFRLALSGAKRVLSFDPIERCWLQCEFLRTLSRSQVIAALPLGLENLNLFSEHFDRIFCLGVLYHQRDPIKALELLRSALKSGGSLVLESITVPIRGSYVLRPEERYAKMRNCWQVPSAESLYEWLIEAGFKNTTLLHSTPITKDEQRRSEWSPYESLSDFLDPYDSTRTIEGYPAPWKTAYLASI